MDNKDFSKWLEIDDEFKEDMCKHFGNTFLVEEKIDDYLKTINEVSSVLTDKSLYIDIINTIKAKDAVGETYSDCKETILRELNLDLSFLDIDELDKIIVAFAMKYLLLKGKGITDDSRKENISMTKTFIYDGEEQDIVRTSDLSPVVNWDEYFYNVCLQVSRNSKCLSRRIGAIVVRDNTIIGTGYNGPPRGLPRCDERWKIDDEMAVEFGKLVKEGKVNSHHDDCRGKCPRQVMGFKSGEGLDWCVAGHAEENAIINCARLGICTLGAKMYMTCGVPCSKCFVKIINSGIEELIVTSFNMYDRSTKYLWDQSNVRVRLFNFIKKNN